MSEHLSDVDLRLVGVAVERALTARSRVEVDELLEQLRPKHFSTELMVRPHTAADVASV